MPDDFDNLPWDDIHVLLYGDLLLNSNSNGNSPSGNAHAAHPTATASPLGAQPRQQTTPINRDPRMGNPGGGAFGTPLSAPTPAAGATPGATKAKGQTGRRPVSTQRRYTDLEDRYIAEVYHQGLAASWTKSKLQSHISTFLSARGPKGATPNSVLGRYQRMARRYKGAKFPDMVDGQYLTATHRSLLGIAAGANILLQLEQGAVQNQDNAQSVQMQRPHDNGQSNSQNGRRDDETNAYTTSSNTADTPSSSTAYTPSNSTAYSPSSSTAYPIQRYYSAGIDKPLEHGAMTAHSQANVQQAQATGSPSYDLYGTDEPGVNAALAERDAPVRNRLSLVGEADDDEEENQDFDPRE